MELINEQAFQDIFKAEVKEFLQKNKPLPRVGEGEKGNGLSDNKPVLFLTEGNRDVAGLL